MLSVEPDTANWVCGLFDYSFIIYPQLYYRLWWYPQKMKHGVEPKNYHQFLSASFRHLAFVHTCKPDYILTDHIHIYLIWLPNCLYLFYLYSCTLSWMIHIYYTNINIVGHIDPLLCIRITQQCKPAVLYSKLEAHWLILWFIPGNNYS